MMFHIAPLTIAALVTLAAMNVWPLLALMQDHDPAQQVVDAKSRWTPNISSTTLALPEGKALSAYSETLARPVFFKTRQSFVPPPPAPPPAPKQEAPPQPAAVVDPGLVLGGIMIDGDAKRAYLFNRADLQGRWLSEGDIVTGWQLHAIDATSVRLQQRGRTILLQLYPAGP